jgi:uncharacterized protein YlzI (FlbEa/FlbD family)
MDSIKIESINAELNVVKNDMEEVVEQVETGLNELS